MAFKFDDAKKVAFTILEQLGERTLRRSGDAGLARNIQEMKHTLQNMSDESILNLHESNEEKRDFILMNLYHDLNFLMGQVDTTLTNDTSLRMVEITLSNGLCRMSPFAFAQFAITLIKFEEYALGYRLGTLSLKLLDTVNAQRYTSMVVALVGNFISWVA